MIDMLPNIGAAELQPTEPTNIQTVITGSIDVESAVPAPLFSVWPGVEN